MSTLISICDAHKRYGPQVLLDGATVTLPDDCKIGMIGRNGSGKSTLCRILLDEEELDRGEVIRHPRLRLGYLRQHDPFEPGETVLGFLQRETGEPEWRCGEVAAEFELKGAALERPIAEFSGGWQTRVKLSALLLGDPNLLLLDEPTNFLDLRTQLLLEEFLKHFRGGCLVVSHDRTFLRDTCTHTLELARGRLTLYPGNIDAYLVNLAERQEHDLRVNAATLSKRRHLETFIDKNRARASTASQARSKQKQLERLQLKEVESAEKTVRIRAPAVEPRGGTALRLRELSIGYADRLVASEINLEIEHGSRTAIVGDNGQGKTTFLRTVVASLAPLSGEPRWGYGCRIGVYAQHVYTTLPASDSVLEYLEHVKAPEIRPQAVLDTAGSFLFQGEMVHKRIEVLSGGERARLCLAGLLLAPYNVLVLDEPGNHLDVETVEALADALTEYRGTVLFTSHDRHFMRRVATAVVEVRDGRVATYSGDYDTYLYRVSKEIEDGRRGAEKQRAAAATGQPPRPNSVPAADRKEQARREREKDRARQREAAALQRKIARLEQRKAELNRQLMASTDPTEAQRLHQEIVAIAAEIEPAEAKWLELSVDETGS